MRAGAPYLVRLTTMILAGISYDHGWPLWLTLTALGVMAGTVLITITDLSTERP